MKIQHALLEKFIADIYEGNDVPAGEAKMVAHRQVEANLMGHDSHGVIKTADYLSRIERGHIVPGAEFEIENETPTTAVVNGNWGFGFVVNERAMKLAIAKAKLSGVAALTVRHQGHIGRLGAYSAMAAAEGMIAIVTADSGLGPKSATPYGGRERRLGTNPISIAVPSGQDGVVCIDIATTSVASGKLQVARSRGEKIPFGWILDRDGKPSDEPGDYYDGGSLLPVGADQGHKGYGLSFMVEVLSGILTGLGFGIDPKGRHNDGCFIAVFDVARFRPDGAFSADIDEFIDYLKATKLADGFTEVLYPGELERRREVALTEAGIDIDDHTWAELVAAAQKVGVGEPDSTTSIA